MSRSAQELKAREAYHDIGAELLVSVDDMLACSSNLQRYIQNRKVEDTEFAEGFDEGYDSFKVGVLLRQLREEEGLTQAEIAQRLHTKKSAISHIENHSEDVKLSTLEKFAAALGKRLEIKIA